MRASWLKVSFWKGTGVVVALALSHTFLYGYGAFRMHEKDQDVLTAIRKEDQEKIDSLTARVTEMSALYFKARHACPIPPPEETDNIDGGRRI
jgi:hypothetical protein